jgi:hypothetical protein
MGLNRVCNPAKLRKLSARVGAPVIRAYSRFFADQNTLLAFTDESTAWVVPREGPVERYADEGVRLVDKGVRVGLPVAQNS